jgi:hypothetical protein
VLQSVFPEQVCAPVKVFPESQVKEMELVYGPAGNPPAGTL